MTPENTEQELTHTDRIQQKANSVYSVYTHLEEKEDAHYVSVVNDTIDFKIGDPEILPSSLNDDELNAITTSSVKITKGGWGNGFGKIDSHAVGMGGGIHLPPAREELWEKIENNLNLPEEVTVVNGTYQFGSLVEPPNGICTPHVLVTDVMEVNEFLPVLDQLFEVYRTVYNCGDEVVRSISDVKENE